MSSIYSEQGKNRFRTFLLMASFFGLVIGVGFVMAQVVGDPVFIYGAIGISIVMNIGAYWFSDKVVIKMSGAKEAKRSEYFDLYNAVENLSITAGVPMPKVYVIEDPVPNAFATGRNKKTAIVAVSTGLLAIMEKNELEGVVAHELAHIKNNDMFIATLAVVLAGVISIIADIFLRTRMFGGDNDKGGGVLILVGIAISILTPLFATLLRLAISRKREYLADATGALFTRYPEGLARALEKLEGSKGTMQNAHGATAHLYIANPFGGKKTLMSLFSTHPSTQSRIQRLRKMV